LGKPTNVTTSPQLAEDLIKEFKFFDQPPPGINRAGFDFDLRFAASMYEMALNFYTSPSLASIREYHRPLGNACRSVIREIEKLQPFFRVNLDNDLYAKMKVISAARSDFPEIIALSEVCKIAAEYCEMLQKPIFERARTKEYLEITARILIEIWERYSGLNFDRNYRNAKGKRGQEFVADGPRFVQRVLQDLDHRLTTNQVERAIRKALAPVSDGRYSAPDS
jgi:hypothetical protein